MIKVRLVKEAVKPVMQRLGDLNPGDAFELGGSYYVKYATPSLLQKGSTVKQIGCIHLSSFTVSRLPDNIEVKSVFIDVNVRELDEELKI